MSDLIVIKRDGNSEPWSSDKIIASVGKCGVEVKTAENICSNIKLWFENNSRDSKISSKEIRDRVVEELKNVDPVASESYRVFKRS